jgi:glycosyltransferase involved in cell wall biosynthesis
MSLESFWPERRALGTAERLRQTNRLLADVYQAELDHVLSDLMQWRRRSSPALPQRPTLRFALGHLVRATPLVRSLYFALRPGARRASRHLSPRPPGRLIRETQAHAQHFAALPAATTPRYRIPVRPEATLYLLHNSRPYQNGGYAVRSHGIVQALNSWGYDVTPVLRPGYPNDVEGVTGDNLRSHVVGDVTYRFAPDVANRRRMSRHAYADAYFRYLCAVVEAVRPSVIHAASFHHNAHAALQIREKYGIPVVYEVRGLSILNDISKVTRHKTLRKLVFPTPLRFWEFREEVECARRADHLLCITDAVADLFRTLGVADARVSVLPNGVDGPAGSDVDAPGPVRHGHVVGYLGSLQHYEGLEDLCTAIEILASTRPELDVRALIVGDGPYAPVVHARIASSPCRDRFEVHPRVPHDRIGDYYSRCSLLAYPRRPVPISEYVSPLKPFEPMARGIPVLASDVPALAQIVRNGETGFTFPAGSADALAAGIAMVLTSDTREVTERARRHVANHCTWRELTAPVAQLYRRLFESASGGGTQGADIPALSHTIGPENDCRDATLPA